MSSPFDWIRDELDRLHKDHLFRESRFVNPLGNGRCEIDGQELIDFGSNDYLALSRSSALSTAAVEATQSHGVGARASALISGTHAWHRTLCEKLAEFERSESALLFPTGYMANLGTITALAGRDDAVFCDRLNHASLIDGCRLSRARFRVYPHTDLEILERELNKIAGDRRKLIVTDGLFSMDGDLAPLPELWALAERYNTMLLVDEAHATGVLGPSGRGSIEHFGLEGKPIVRVGTLSKAIGCLGGFVAGPQSLIDFLRNGARTQIYTTALPAAVCAAACAALDHIRQHPEEREKLQELSELLRRELTQQSLEYAPGSCGPIVPVILNDPERAVTISGALRERGFFVPAIRPPTVPAGTSRLRITVCCAHRKEDIRSLVSHLRDVV
jgi:8-amino-7-oxononanoate synthase